MSGDKLNAFISNAILRAAETVRCEQMHSGPDGWSEWVHPEPGFLMQCCDCDLIHQMEFAIVARGEADHRLSDGESDGGVIVFRARRTTTADAASKTGASRASEGREQASSSKPREES